jgi:beta-xylosidase
MSTYNFGAACYYNKLRQSLLYKIDQCTMETKLNDAIIYYYDTHHTDQLLSINSQLVDMTRTEKKNSLKLLVKDIIECDKQISINTGTWGGTSNQMESILSDD